jgi:hypothetical protein
MLKHETKLIDPDAEQIVAALTQAAEDANKRCRARLLEDAPDKWRKFARDCAAKPEGWAMFRGGKGGVPATQVLAAWWTDSIGRRHVVIRGRRVEHDDAKRLLLKDELDQRPPLWHAYPEYVCRRAVGTESALVCACGCGAVGTPEALGWMGETCGPCFDRAQDDGPDALRHNLPGVVYGDRSPLTAVACSPDGTRVAAVEGDSITNGVALYADLAARSRAVLKFPKARVTDVAITPDSRHLVATTIPFNTGGMIAAFDLSADPPRRADNPYAERPVAWRVAPLPDPDTVLIHRPDPTGAHSHAEVVRVPGGDPVRSIHLPTGCAGRFVLSPDARRVAVPGQTTLVYDLATGRRISQIAGYSHNLAFTPDGERVIGGYGEMLRSFDVLTGAPDGPSGRVGSGYNFVAAVAADPRGEWVFVGGSNGSVTVLDAATFDRRAAFEWHLGAVTGLAVSADGSRLFSAGGDGCVKVWPIRDLMKGL